MAVATSSATYVSFFQRGSFTEATDILAGDKQIAAFPLKDVTVKIVPVERMFEE